MIPLSIFTLSLFWQTSISDPNNFNGYLILGYAVMGLIGLGYIVSLAARQRNLQKDIQLLQNLLQEDEGNGDT